MTIFGAAWEELMLQDLTDFLHDGASEPLLWEAKRDLNKSEVRAQVCGFANGHDTGYLIIGADQAKNGTWTFEGLEPPAAGLPSQITDYLHNGGVEPFPEGLDVRTLDIDNGRQIAVVRIPPIATPPCNTRGTVYERVSGKTIPVKDPVRLNALFEQGARARERAREAAARAAELALDRGSRSFDSGHIQFGFGLAATGYTRDVRTRPFTPTFESVARSSLLTVLAHDPLQPPIAKREVNQETLILETNPEDKRLGYNWMVRASTDGAIGVFWLQGITQTNIESLTGEPLRRVWECANEIIGMHNPRGARYMHVLFAGGEFPRNKVLSNARVFPAVARGPLGKGIDHDVLGSIGRELRRYQGEMAWEPDDA
jgi:hypothetical protein